MSLSYHTLILRNDGTLWGCGRNYYGRLGLGDESDRTTLTQIITNTDNIKSVYCGTSHTLILKNDGTLWGCGWNGEGELGLGDTSNRITLTQITTNTNDIKSVYCGGNYTIILKNDNTLWGCGANNRGQLGLGDTNNRVVLTKITDDVKLVGCGYEHTIILKNDGTLWGCGYNAHGDLGLGDDTDRVTFTQITTNADNIKSIYSGSNHILILKNDNTLWGCGYNEHGQLGLGNTTDKTVLTKIITNANNIKSVYCGGPYTFILKNDGTLWACGKNDCGQLGLGDTTNRSIFTIIGINSGNIRKIYCGYYYVSILKNDGTLWGCGDNQYGQLGLER